MPIRVRRPSSNVQAERLKGGGTTLSVFQPPDERKFPWKRSQRACNTTHRRLASADPLPRLVEGRFRILTECAVGAHQQPLQDFNPGEYRARLRARRFDEQIVRTVAVSTAGLLAQLRLLFAFYEESENGAGRRSCLLIQSIAAGIERLDPTRGDFST